MTEIRITQINVVYHVEMPDGKIYCLNKVALKWNLKHVIKQTSKDITKIMSNLDKRGLCSVYLAS